MANVSEVEEFKPYHQIEVTDQMVEAGVAALYRSGYGNDFMEWDAVTTVRSVFLDMVHAAPPHGPEHKDA